MLNTTRKNTVVHTAKIFEIQALLSQIEDTVFDTGTGCALTYLKSVIEGAARRDPDAAELLRQSAAVVLGCAQVLGGQTTFEAADAA